MSHSTRILLAVVFVFLAPAVSPAQYMYLDVDGDGVHTDADVVPASGEAAVDVWLVTDAGRDGTPAVCLTGDDPFRISSYVVNLRASGGTIAWGAFENRMPTFTIDLPGGQDPLEFQEGAATMYPVDPGRYRLATIHLSVASGTPRIDFVPTSKYLTGPTSFGSPCSGWEFDNTLKLGSEWFDADGLDYPAAGQAPAFDPLDDLAMDENSTASRHVAATDPDGDALTLTLQGLPGFATSTPSSHAAGRVEAASPSPEATCAGFCLTFMAGRKSSFNWRDGSRTAPGSAARPP